MEKKETNDLLGKLRELWFIIYLNMEYTCLEKLLYLVKEAKTKVAVFKSILYNICLYNIFILLERNIYTL